MQDIVPKGGRSIRKVPLPEGRQRTERAAPKKEIPKLIEELAKPKAPEPLKREEIKEPIETVTESEAPREDHVSALRDVREEFEASRERRIRKGKNLKVGLITLAIVAVLGLAVFVSNLFHSAVLSVSPRVAAAAISDDLVAKRAGGLTYQAVTLKEEGSSTVKATGEEAVSKKASGTVVIYNNYNSSSQRLIKNTRFETPEGLIFRVSDSVTVPGKKGSTPGSVEATIVADEPGDKYNVGLKDFTIPGFKGDPRYATF